MRFTTVTTLLAIIPVLSFASPLPEAGVQSRTLGQTGSYTVSGLGARKKQLIACGANELDLAIAMLECVHRCFLMGANDNNLIPFSGRNGCPQTTLTVTESQATPPTS
jgi:hypothetical protein